MPEIIAHRGSSGTHPENTMAAFIEAERVKADGIEFDVHMTKDEELVVIHDERVDRTTDGNGWVKTFTLKELKKLNAGSTKNHSEKIPTLKEVFGWAAANNLLLNIELKTGLIDYPKLEERLVGLIKQFGLEKRVILSSFNHYSVEKIHKIDSSIQTAILFMEGLFEPWKYARAIGASALHCHRRAAAPEMIEGAIRAKMAIRLFTVNKKADLQRFMRSGCTGVFTDWPERAIHVREALKKT
ncbi:MAG TPA: glycerophosphodiester phosphodiesterase [Bacillales bacterium]|nr:glycerophosphodiester phosphodiesterase [Bacillales bacterium]